jgi:hypothetical protein
MVPAPGAVMVTVPRAPVPPTIAKAVPVGATMVMVARGAVRVPVALPAVAVTVTVPGAPAAITEARATPAGAVMATAAPPPVANAVPVAAPAAAALVTVGRLPAAATDT